MLLDRGYSSEIWVQLTVTFLAWFKSQRQIEEAKAVEASKEEECDDHSKENPVEIKLTQPSEKPNKYNLYCLFCSSGSNSTKSSTVNNGAGFSPLAYELLFRSRKGGY